MRPIVKYTGVFLTIACSSVLAQDNVVPDAEIVQWATDACQAKDFSGFFSHFAQNAAVREAYTADQVELRSLLAPTDLSDTVAGESYHDFTIQLIDYSYVDAESWKQYDAGNAIAMDDLKVDFSPLNDDAYRVDYTKAEMAYDEETDAEVVVRTYGDPGAYVFEFQGGCWRLVQDLR